MTPQQYDPASVRLTFNGREVSAHPAAADDIDDEHYFDPDEDPVYREELDFARGICRECDTWGDIQCRIHGDATLEALRQEHELYWIGVMSRRGKRTKAGRKARFRLNAMWWQQ